ncbi:MAG: ribose 5-phosphate isomerase B [Candidatus Diapherotrites archaeon]|nr:ribose 5-phosphate isomerase B [Candidatus Diapherotrites archaeon]
MLCYIASDHGGFALKEALKESLAKKFEVKDLGCDSEESCDYPDFAVLAAKAVAKEKGSLGILCCGTGIGMSLAANKVKGIRAAVVYDEFTAKMAREHNNANIACFGGRNIKPETAAQLAGLFLTAKFAGETKEGARHLKRVLKIGEIEKRYFK